MLGVIVELEWTDGVDRERVQRITGLYRARSTVTFVDVVELVDNAPTTAAGR